MAKLILTAVLSAFLGGLVIHVYEHQQLSATEEILRAEQRKNQQAAQDRSKALANSGAFPGGMGSSFAKAH
jgi:hypothetical protein